MNATLQAILAGLGVLLANLTTAWMGTNISGDPITQFSDLNEVQYAIAFAGAGIFAINQRLTAKRPPVA